MWKTIGVVSVDSGTLMLADPCYLEDEGWTKDDYKKYLLDNEWKYNIQVNHELGHAGKAVIFSTGLGDGIYKVEAKIKDLAKECPELYKTGQTDKRITEIRVKFL